jgi:hypothetical protein
LMLSHCPEKRPTTYGIRARPPLNQYTKTVNMDEQWHFELPSLRRDTNKTPSLSSSSTGSWEQVWNDHKSVIWCSPPTANTLVIYIAVCDIRVMSGVSNLFIKVATMWLREHILPPHCLKMWALSHPLMQHNILEWWRPLLNVVLILTQFHLKLLVSCNLCVHSAVSIIFVLLGFFLVSVSSQKLIPFINPTDILRTCRKIPVKYRSNAQCTDIPELYKRCHGVMNCYEVGHTWFCFCLVVECHRTQLLETRMCRLL